MSLPTALVSLLAAILIGLFAFTQWQARRIESMYPPQGRFVEALGHRLHYTERAGPTPDAPTIVLLHGASGTQADVMLPLGDLLAARGYHVLAFDRPGHGWSDRPGGAADADPALQARIIRAGLDALHVRKPLIVGHSLAGVMTVNMALDHADLIAGIVLLSPVTHPWPGGVATYYTLAADPIAGAIFTNLITLPLGMAILDKAVASVFAPRLPPPDYDARTGVELVLRPHDFQANAQDVTVLEAFVRQQAPRMGAIRMPVTVMTGDQDGIVLAHIHSDGTARDVPGAKLIVLEGVGHSPHWAEPERVADAIVETARAAGLLGRL